MIHPMGIPILLQHIFKPFQANDIREGHHMISENFIWGMIHVNIIVFRCIVAQPRSPQHFQKTKL
ncbi:hypothetical protein D3C74_382120 [compost metagenome]